MTICKFSEADMMMKLKDCQKVTVEAYQHWGSYLERDKVWYQDCDVDVWRGPALIICKQGVHIAHWLVSTQNMCHLEFVEIFSNFYQDKMISDLFEFL